MGERIDAQLFFFWSMQILSHLLYSNNANWIEKWNLYSSFTIREPDFSVSIWPYTVQFITILLWTFLDMVKNEHHITIERWNKKTYLPKSKQIKMRTEFVMQSKIPMAWIHVAFYMIEFLFMFFPCDCRYISNISLDSFYMTHIHIEPPFIMMMDFHISFYFMFTKLF